MKDTPDGRSGAEREGITSHEPAEESPEAPDRSNVEEIEVAQGDDEQWYWHGKAGNGEIVVQGEGYTRSEDAVRAAEDVLPGVKISVATTFNEPTDTGDEDATEDDGA